MDAFSDIRGLAGMSIEYVIDNAFVVVTPCGFNTLDDMVNVFKKILSDPAVNLPMKIIFDAHNTDYGPPSEELEALVDFLGKLDAFRDARWAIVSYPNTLVYGLARMFCCLAESQGMVADTFTDQHAARTWLCAPEPQPAS